MDYGGGLLAPFLGNDGGSANGKSLTEGSRPECGTFARSSLNGTIHSRKIWTMIPTSATRSPTGPSISTICNLITRSPTETFATVSTSMPTSTYPGALSLARACRHEPRNRGRRIAPPPAAFLATRLERPTSTSRSTGACSDQSDSASDTR